MEAPELGAGSQDLPQVVNEDHAASSSRRGPTKYNLLVRLLLDKNRLKCFPFSIGRLFYDQGSNPLHRLPQKIARSFPFCFSDLFQTKNLLKLLILLERTLVHLLMSLL